MPETHLQIEDIFLIIAEGIRDKMGWKVANIGVEYAIDVNYVIGGVFIVLLVLFSKHINLEVIGLPSIPVVKNLQKFILYNYKYTCCLSSMGMTDASHSLILTPSYIINTYHFFHMLPAANITCHIKQTNFQFFWNGPVPEAVNWYAFFTDLGRHHKYKNLLLLFNINDKVKFVYNFMLIVVSSLSFIFVLRNIRMTRFSHNKCHLYMTKDRYIKKKHIERREIYSENIFYVRLETVIFDF
ncbi:hypothetical protein ACJX0J_023861 [Zea mays]